MTPLSNHLFLLNDAGRVEEYVPFDGPVPRVGEVVHYPVMGLLGGRLPPGEDFHVLRIPSGGSILSRTALCTVQRVQYVTAEQPNSTSRHLIAEVFVTRSTL